MTPFRPAGLVLLALGLLCWTFAASTVSAQTQESSLSLFSSQTKLNRLAPGEGTASATFTVDATTEVVVDVTATIDDLVTRIVGPGGEVLTPSTVSTFGGSFDQYTVETAPSLIFVTPFSADTHYLYTFVPPSQGTYTVEYEVPMSFFGEVNVITQLFQNSPVRAALFATEPVLPLGNPLVLSAFLFEDDAAISGATVEATVLVNGEAPFTVTLADDGGDADDTAGDGLYSGEFTPNAPGTYRALAVMNGTSSTGAAFTRQAAAEVTVVTPAGSILNGSIQDEGVDDDGNGLFDRFRIDVGINAVEAGTHLAYVYLRSPSGQALVRNGRLDVTGGAATIPVNFSAEDVFDLGEGGPYAIERIDLVFVGDDGTVPSDRLLNAGQTQAYALSQFERPAILLTGGSTDTPRDTNGNGLFDRLDVTVDVNLLSGGFYQWSGRLVDDLGNEIEFVGNSGFLSTGDTQITFTFDGTAIGANGVDGPYVLTDLLMFSSSSGANLVASSVAVTAPYDVEQFEGVPERCPATLRLTGFDADQGESDTEEFVTVTNTGTERVLVTDCALVFYDGFAEATYFALDLQGAVEPGASHVVGNPGLQTVAQTFPINTLDDGPDAIALYQRPASDFPAGTGLVTDATLLSAIVYVSDDEIFGAKRGGTGSASDVLASLRDLVDDTAGLPEVLTLEGNAPNPFRTSTQIRFALPQAAGVTLDLYDVLGRRVLRVVDAELPAGWHTARVDGARLASGAYFYRLQAGNETLTRSLRLVK